MMPAFLSLAFFQDNAGKTFLLYHRLPLQQVFTTPHLQCHNGPGNPTKPMQNTAAPGAAGEACHASTAFLVLSPSQKASGVRQRGGCLGWA